MIKKLIFSTILGLTLVFASCGSQGEKAPGVGAAKQDDAASDKGIGKFKDLKLTTPLDSKMVEAGEATYNTKCIACHKLTNEKLVGPGWAGVTSKRRPEWILNFETNTNAMLDSDIVAQQLLVTCVARMPNQNLSDDDARSVLEFMRKNDGQK